MFSQHNFAWLKHRQYEEYEELEGKHCFASIYIFKTQCVLQNLKVLNFKRNKKLRYITRHNNVCLVKRRFTKKT